MIENKLDDHKITPTTKEKVQSKKSLPKTGQVAASIFYLSGAMMTGLGFVLLKKRRNKED